MTPLTPSASSEPKWRWCVCTNADLLFVKCAKCSKLLGYTYESIIEYQGSHWHTTCLLNRLTGDYLC